MRKNVTIPDNLSQEAKNFLSHIAKLVRWDEELSSLESFKINGELLAIKKIDSLFNNEFNPGFRQEIFSNINNVIIYEYHDDEYPYELNKLFERSINYIDYYSSAGNTPKDLLKDQLEFIINSKFYSDEVKNEAKEKLVEIS